MRKRLSSERGFTLTELLIVVAILGVLVAVVLPNFIGLLDNANSSAASAELRIVQTAVDTRMADTNTSTVTPITTATDDMTTTGFDLHPTYMRSQQTNGTYTMDAAGQVTQVDY